MTSMTAPHLAGSPPVGTGLSGDADTDDVLAGLSGDVAASVPGLGAVLEALGRVDRAVAAAVDGLLELEDSRLVETVTQLPVEQWLSIVGRRTRADRRMLLTTVAVLRRLPSLRAAFCSAATVSWAQVRTIVLEVHRLPRGLDGALDEGIGAAIERCVGADPDVLVTEVGWVIAEVRRGEERASSGRTEPVEEFLALQPRLDGTGGRVWGEFGPVGFATLDAALATGPVGDGCRDGVGQEPDGDRVRATAATAGRARAARLLQLCDRHLAGSADSGDAGETFVAADHGSTDAADAGSGGGDHAPTAAGRVQLLVRAELSALLDRDQIPAALLTHLSGGRMWLDAATARRLVEVRGADLRMVVLDETGAVVGVGRRRRVAPGWLSDALLAVHDTCSGPGCVVAARACDVDHARPWQPVRPGDVPGATDVGELAPLCRTDNRTKERAGWIVSQQPDGTRVWRHQPTGLSTRTVPATRPPGRVRSGPTAGFAPGAEPCGEPDRPSGDAEASQGRPRAGPSP